MKSILLLHGALGSKSQLAPLKLSLEAKAKHVYTLNFSGHSGEPFKKDQFGIEAFAADVLEFLNSHGLDQVNIFGYSMGGYVALWLACHNPDRIAAIMTLGTKFDWNIESADREVRKLDPEKIIQKAPAFARILEHRHAPYDWKELLFKTSEMMLRLGKDPLLTEGILEKISHRILIGLGDQDDMADRKYSEQVAATLPQGEFIVLPDTHHPIEKVNVENLTGIILDWFKL